MSKSVFRQLLEELVELEKPEVLGWDYYPELDDGSKNCWFVGADEEYCGAGRSGEEALLRAVEYSRRSRGLLPETNQ